MSGTFWRVWKRFLTPVLRFARKMYVVDTCIINRLVDGLLSTSDLPGDGEFLATHVQVDELNKTSNSERRAQLFLKFTTTIDAMVPTESVVLGVSRLGHSKVSDGTRYDILKADLDSMNHGKANNAQDALIAEVAIANGYVLLTADCDLAKAAERHGCKVRHFSTKDR